MKVCVLTESQAKRYELSGILPDCANLNRLRRRIGLPDLDHSGSHVHMDIEEANREVGEREGYRNARWVIDRFAIAYNTKGGWNYVRGSMQMTRETSGFRHPGHTRGPIPSARDSKTKHECRADQCYEV